MRKQSWLVLTFLILFFYVLNYLMPMAFGDDYVYSFVWQGNPEFVPLTEDAVRVSSVCDLINSQWSHYFTWSGRTISHVIAQFFLWKGKGLFDFFNAFISLFLIIEIYWCSNKGIITLYLNPARLVWIFLVLWFFTPGFAPVFFWLTGACNYLWTTVFLLGFQLFYIRKYYVFEKSLFPKGRHRYLLFLFGVVAGWSNENSICWIIMLLIVFLLVTRTQKGFENWMVVGLVGLIIGYTLLTVAPGNYTRLLVSHGGDWFDKAKFMGNLHVFTVVLVSQFFLWYYCVRSLFKISYSFNNCRELEKEMLKKEVLLIKSICVVAMGMSACMVFSPEFHLRSAFPGTVQLIIATCILLRIQKEYNIELLQLNAKKFLVCVGVVFFVVSAGVTLHHLYEHRIYNEKLLSYVTALREKGNEKKEVLSVEPFPATSKMQDFISGYHTFDANVTDNADSWINVAFARYYCIKGVRVLNADEEKVTK